MSRTLRVFISSALLLLGALPDCMSPRGTAWAQRPKSGGDVFRDCPGCPEMVVLPAGSFMMGKRDTPSEYHPVTIAEPFSIGRYEVTFAEWDACAADGGCKGYKPKDKNWGRGRHPVINVSWEGAQEYLYWLGRKTGKPYRLPSEAEWEYAVRAGTTTDHYWGNYSYREGGDDGRICAYANVGASTFDCDQKERTMPVGSFRPNQFGLYDMIGNVREWTADCWNQSYQGAPGNGSPWQQGDCDWRVTRGGSFDIDDYTSFDFGSTARTQTHHRRFTKSVGFRVARAMAGRNRMPEAKREFTREQDQYRRDQSHDFQRRKRSKSVGDVFRDCPGCPEMVVLPAGIFMMGDRDDRSEYHTVKIAQPFAVGRYEVTFAEWDACVAEGGCNGYQPGHNRGRGRHPVINVSWNDAQNYLYWIGRKTGESYRLPSEAEWEYAVRAGTTTKNFWGDSDPLTSSEICAYAKVSARFGCAGNGSGTVPVGAFRSNLFGLHDMIGNVQEWTADCWNRSYRGAPADGRAWQQGDCNNRVVRGSSYLREDVSHDSAARRFTLAGWREPHIGFRVARELGAGRNPRRTLE